MSGNQRWQTPWPKSSARVAFQPTALPSTLGPWRQKKKKVPDYVLEHYLSSKANELAESVILHPRTMSPLVAELVRSTVKGEEREKWFSKDRHFGRSSPPVTA
jgi:hypothetical protein